MIACFELRSSIQTWCSVSSSITFYFWLDMFALSSSFQVCRIWICWSSWAILDSKSHDLFAPDFISSNSEFSLEISLSWDFFKSRIKMSYFHKYLRFSQLHLQIIEFLCPSLLVNRELFVVHSCYLQSTHQSLVYVSFWYFHTLSWCLWIFTQNCEETFLFDLTLNGSSLID